MLEKNPILCIPIYEDLNSYESCMKINLIKKNRSKTSWHDILYENDAHKNVLLFLPGSVVMMFLLTAWAQSWKVLL